MRKVARIVGGIVVVAGVALGPAGCGDPLLSENEPRSQYDLTDAARDRRAPTYVWDNKGDRQPNIRGRVLNGAE
ncbi:hypothetical protein PHYC_01152 [Phycisphaerales bacterium]|nr:hypothetical protein PHYC_01152 [Phycisphaerales bacterium]